MVIILYIVTTYSLSGVIGGLLGEYKGKINVKSMTQQEIDKFQKAYKVLLGEMSARNLVMRKVYIEAHTTKHNGISGFRLADIELAYLQIRKTLELIAFWVVIAQRGCYEKS